jgi:hypothetical protein
MYTHTHTHTHTQVWSRQDVTKAYAAVVSQRAFQAKQQQKLIEEKYAKAADLSAKKAAALRDIGACNTLKHVRKELHDAAVSSLQEQTDLEATYTHIRECIEQCLEAHTSITHSLYAGKDAPVTWEDGLIADAENVGARVQLEAATVRERALRERLEELKRMRRGPKAGLQEKLHGVLEKRRKIDRKMDALKQRWVAGLRAFA